jgi:hypothetical protein
LYSQSTAEAYTLTSGQKFNKEYFINEILEGTNKECNQGTGYRITKATNIYIGISRVHNALETAEKKRK